ncbi:hypothetical protein ACI7BZ_21645 [Xanthobacter sp. AM11]|uniref:hypothetical protein n=1 Tax=Xanthobacter sp. AM11 TaxID=3380643 RepID=UPI0039BF291C
MSVFLSEASFYHNRPTEIVDILCGQLAQFGSIVLYDDSYVLNFEVGKAKLKAIENMIMIRVESGDLISSYAIKTLIEGHLVEVDDIKETAILWIPVKVEPFASLADCTSLMKKK